MHSVFFWTGWFYVLCIFNFVLNKIIFRDCKVTKICNVYVCESPSSIPYCKLVGYA